MEKIFKGASNDFKKTPLNLYERTQTEKHNDAFSKYLGKFFLNNKINNLFFLS